MLSCFFHIKNKKAPAGLFLIGIFQITNLRIRKNHSIMDDIKKLHEKKLISWQNLYFYYRINEETKLPHIMICSNEPLSYNPLKDYNILVETNRKQVSTV